MRRRQFVATVVGASGFAALGGWAVAASPFGPKLKWQKDLKAARKLALAEDKLILVVFTAEWCTYCHKLVDNTVMHRDLVPFIDRHFVPVLLDFDTNKRTAEILEVESLPHTVVLSPMADLLAERKGFAQVAPFKQTLQSALDKQAEILQVRAAGK